MAPLDHTTGLTQERLKALLAYDPETGAITWRSTIGRRAKAGSIAGTISTQGYRVIKIEGRSYAAARLAWLYMVGTWPIHYIDHKDNDKTNNSWTNLRAATHAENIRNRPVQANARSGFKGVHFSPTRTSYKKWAAHIRVGGVLRTLGYFADPAEAHAVYTKAAQAAFGSFARS